MIVLLFNFIYYFLAKTNSKNEKDKPSRTNVFRGRGIMPSESNSISEIGIRGRGRGGGRGRAASEQLRTVVRIIVFVYFIRL